MTWQLILQLLTVPVVCIVVFWAIWTRIATTRRREDVTVTTDAWPNSPFRYFPDGYLTLKPGEMSAGSDTPPGSILVHKTARHDGILWTLDCHNADGTARMTNADGALSPRRHVDHPHSYWVVRPHQAPQTTQEASHPETPTPMDVAEFGPPPHRRSIP